GGSDAIMGGRPDIDPQTRSGFKVLLAARDRAPVAQAAIDLLQFGAFLSADGVDVAIIAVGTEKARPYKLAQTILDVEKCERAVALLCSVQLLRCEAGPYGALLTFAAPALEVVRDWMDDEARNYWASTAADILNEVFPGPDPCEPGHWPLCARLLPHV